VCEEAVDQHQANVCFNALATLYSEGETAVILFERAEKAFDGSPSSSPEACFDCAAQVYLR
jgi:hypothetical protein